MEIWTQVGGCGRSDEDRATRGNDERGVGCDIVHNLNPN
jgi:hypothetical protein